ncbi:IS110 family RNA-guided transposase [Roseicella frigidaeris]|uniref:IS110 family transposase n=1 Tax=Roseicella frigidaeris TaxID=2230885 RepID=A0A327M3C5_9PROT|nr:IS110 family transposase [Roseicella frigidaeris]RAI54558.1 IS110 family transposase [Roseicella frigidaeris]
MEHATTIGLDLAKNVLQVHGVNAAGQVVLRRKLRRAAVLEFFAALPPALVGMEACGGAHYWARELTRLGHTVRLMPPAYVKAYVKRGKTDAADAEAICEAVTRPTMRFVPIKTEAQQAGLVELKVRDLLVRQRTQAINPLRSHLAEYGIVAAQGRKVAELIALVRDDDTRLPDLAREALGELVAQIEALEDRIERLDRRMVRHARENETTRRLATIPGIGAIGATALAALVPDPHGFASARHFAAWLGLTPKPHSSGGKERLGRISRQGNSMLRRLLVLGATTCLRHARRSPEAADWATRLLARRPFKVAAVALANKMARIAWALLARGGSYNPSAAAA